MIHYVKGDLLQSKAEALVNTVNTVGVMGKGIALQFREAFPENYRIYRNACKDKRLNIGELLVTEEKNSAQEIKVVINFPTKTHWRFPSEYSYITQGLSALRTLIETRGLRSVAIPPLGSHNGGLDWLKVKLLIEEALKDIDCEIYLYEPSEGIVEKMKSERVKLTPARTMLLLMFADMNRYGEFISVFAAEKLIYFMQRMGGKEFFKIDFQPYIYGPYSGGKVAHVLYYMNGSYIKGMCGMQSRPFDYLWLMEDAEKEALKFINNYKDETLYKICKNTMAFLGGYYSNYSLELLSSVDYILNNNILLKDWREKDENFVLGILSREMQKWSVRKGQLFKPEYLAKAFHYLKDYRGEGYK